MAEAENGSAAPIEGTEPATPETAPAASENSPQPQEADWSKLDAYATGEPIDSTDVPEKQDIPKQENEPEPEKAAKEEQDKPDGDAEESPIPPAQDVEDDANDDQDDDEEELESITETTTDDERKEINLPKPARTRLRRLEKLDKKILKPLREEDTPIDDVWSAIRDYHPTRAQELASRIASASIEAYGDKWLSHLVGEETTVEAVKGALSGQGATPKAEISPQISTEGIPSLKDQPQVQALMKSLTDSYGEDWLDPANDDDMIPDDKLAAQALRAQLAHEQAVQEKLAAAEKELEALKPKVDSVAEQQKAEATRHLEESFTTEVKGFRDNVMDKALPSVIDKFGIKPLESDTKTVKSVKEIVQRKFESQDGYASDFETYAEKQFSRKDDLLKITSRVGRRLEQAVILDVEAKQASDEQQAAELKAQAQRLRELVSDDRDVITVLVNQAASEYLQKEQQPILDLLAENADLKRRGRGRPEIVGGGASAGGKLDVAKIATESDDPLGDMFKARRG